MAADPDPVDLPRVHVPDHLARCLFSVLIFPFTGWLAVRHSLRVNHRLLALDREGAERERRRALLWYRVSLFSFFITTVLLTAWRMRQALEAFGEL
jgi:Interferon-induced transmembrane protein